MNDIQIGNLQVSRTPELIAAEINSVKRQTQNMILYNCIEIGRKLAEAKATVPHGEWSNWLENSVDYSHSTANNLMKIFEEYGPMQLSLLSGNANSQSLGNLSYTQAVILLGIPEDEREAFVQDNDVDHMSTRELKQVVKEKEQAIKDKEQAQKEKEDLQKEKDDILRKLDEWKRVANDKSSEAQKNFEDKQKAENEKNLTERVLREAQSDVKMLQEALQKEREESRKEITRLQLSISETKKLLQEAQEAGNDEDIEGLKAILEDKENELLESKRRVEELQNQLKELPIEASATQIVEKVPEEVEKELEDLRRKVSQINDKSVVKYSIFFEELVAKFKELLGELAKIKESDQQEYEKYKKATIGLLDKMYERLD